MPGTLGERIVAIVLFTITAVVLALAVREASRDHSAAPTANVAALPAEGLVPFRPVTTPTVAPAPTKPKLRPKPAPTRLLLTATGGESWLTARAGSAAGKVLYTGVLPQGRSVSVQAKQLWLRFGGAANLTAQLNGKRLELLPGTYSALISPAGLQQVPG